MGPRSDELAVVDDRLKVHGVAGLRVVDASVMPIIVRGHLRAAVVAIAKKSLGYDFGGRGNRPR